MAGQQLRTLIQHLRRSVYPRSENTLDDAQLLERWNQQHDEAAFEVLLWRHGPMVLSVCLRLLRDSHNIEDAFQAAFLTLVRKGASIRRPEALAAWLYRVTFRIALHLRRESDERARREQPGVETLPSGEADGLSERELHAILDEEIDTLPERYRQALVLCCLEGKTHEEAARLLGRPTGTISCWIKRGRERLHGRLVRRGFAPAAAFAALGEGEARAVLPAALVKSTRRAAIAVVANSDSTVVVISARVAALVDATVRGSAATKSQWALVLGLMFGMAAAGAGIWAYQTPAKPEEKARASTQPQKQETQARTDRYGDPLPEGAIARLGTVRLRQERGFWSDPAFSPDGKQLASQGGTGLRMWSLSDGKLLWSARELTLGMAFSPDGKLLAARDEQSICFLDSTTGRLIHRIPKKDYFLTFSPDGKLVVTCTDTRTAGQDDKTIRVWEIETGQRVVELKGHKASCAAFTADGRTLITSNHDKTICHWDLAEGKLRKCLETNAPQQSRTFCLSPDGRTLAVVPYSREAVRLYDADTGKLRCPLQGAPAASLYGLSFSADSRILATNWAESFAEEATISLWDAGTGKPLRRFRVPNGEVGSLRLAPDGRTLATAGGGSTLHVRDSVTGKPLLDWSAHTESINALQFTPDGRQLVSADHNTLRLWDIASSRHLRELSRETWGIHDLAITPDGRGVFSGGYMAATLRELAIGKERHRFLLDEHPEKVPKPVSELRGHSVGHLGLSADGHTAVCISASPHELQPRHWGSVYEVHIWDLASGRLLGHRELGAMIHLLGITPGATALIERRDTLRPSSEEGIPIRDEANSYQIVLRDLRTGRPLVTLNLPDLFRCYACAVSPDGRTLVTATLAATQKGREVDFGASTIRFWELASGKERQTIAPAGTGWRFSFRKFAFAPDGRTLTTVRDDHTLQLWDTVRGKELLRRNGYDSYASALAFAPDGRSLAIGYTDSTILIWDTATSENDAERSSREPDAKELDQWLSALAGDDAHVAWIAIWKMTAAPRQVLPLLRQRLRPAEAFPADEASRLIDDLDSSDFDKREGASKRLADLGERVVPALEKALKTAPSLEKRRRIESLLPTSDVVRSREILQAVRAIEVLEHIGTEEAQQVLKTLAQGMAESRITREAKRSLERLTAFPPEEKR
jgi:RNA polymerase sigma factor (sigma-70 family)